MCAYGFVWMLGFGLFFVAVVAAVLLYEASSCTQQTYFYFYLFLELFEST